METKNRVFPFMRFDLKSFAMLYKKEGRAVETIFKIFCETILLQEFNGLIFLLIF